MFVRFVSFIQSLCSLVPLVCSLRYPEGGRGSLMSSPLSWISGLSFGSILLSPLLIFCLLPLLFLSCILSAYWPIRLTFPPKKILQYFSLRYWLFGVAIVWWLGDDSWSVVCAACCHVAQVFTTMRLYNIFSWFHCFCSFFLIMVLMWYWYIRRKSTMLSCPGLYAFLTGMRSDRLFIRQFVSDICMFYTCVETGFVDFGNFAVSWLLCGISRWWIGVCFHSISVGWFQRGY